MIVLFLILSVLALAVFLFLQQASFGKVPSGARLEIIKKSPQFVNGIFRNQNETPTFTGGAHFLKLCILAICEA